MKIYLLTVCLLVVLISPAVAQNEPQDTYQGRPIGPTLSADDATSYVDGSISDWFAQKLPDRNPKINSQEMIALAAGIKRVGVTNLIAAYGTTKPDIAYRQNAEYNPQDEMKRAVLEKALSSVATDGDISNILALYDDHPLILEVFVDHPEWDSNPHLTNFLVAQLDKVPEAYAKSDLAPTRLFELAARSKDSNVTNKFDSLLTDATENPDGYPNGHIYTSLIITYYQNGNPIIQKHLPEILETMAKKAKPQTPAPYTEITAGNVFGQFLADIAMKQPSLFAAQSTKDAINKLVDDADNSGTANAKAYIVSAICGNKAALHKLADEYNNPDENTNAAPGFAASERSLIKAYLSTVDCKLDGDKLKETADHTSLAIYDPNTCTWQIPQGG